MSWCRRAAGVNLSRRNGDVTFDGTESRARFGVALCLEILLDVPSYFAAVRGQRASGFSDAAPAVKWQISQVPGTFDLAATVGAALPTGTTAVAGRGVQPYLQWPWSSDLGGGWSLAGMLTNTFTSADAHNKILSETTFLFERAFPERAFIFIEYVGRLPCARRAGSVVERRGRLSHHASPLRAGLLAAFTHSKLRRTTMNVLLLEIFVVLAGSALVPMRSELRPCRPLGIDDEHHSKKVARRGEIS